LPTDSAVLHHTRCRCCATSKSHIIRSGRSSRIARVLGRLHMVGVASRGLASSTLGLGRHGRLRPGAPCSVVVVDRRWPASPRGERWVVQSLITGVGLAYTVGFRPRKEEGRQPTEWTSVCNKSFPHHGVPCCPDATMLGPPYDFLSLSHIVRAAFSHPHGFLQPLIVTNGLIFVGQSLMARTYSRTIGCLHRSRAARQDTGSTPAAPSSTLRFRGLRPGIRCRHHVMEMCWQTFRSLSTPGCVTARRCTQRGQRPCAECGSPWLLSPGTELSLPCMPSRCSGDKGHRDSIYEAKDARESSSQTLLVGAQVHQPVGPCRVFQGRGRWLNSHLALLLFVKALQN
jgi:hypothetical protein